MEDDILLSRFSEHLSRHMGLHFPPERWPDLMRCMHAAAHDFHFSDITSCIRWLLSSFLTRSQIEILAGHLTIGETYFFRDQETLEMLYERVLPPLIQARRQVGKRLRIWSAGCSTGEEAYSIAILLQRLIPDYKTWNITILATDINPHVLNKASSGIYSDWSFRNAPPWLLTGYFRALGDRRYEILPPIREMVTFTYLNLAEDIYPSLHNNTSAMDIIFCRNVLMYLEPGLAAKVVSKHYLSLVDTGWLVVSPTETSQALFTQFMKINFPGVILHQKGVGKTLENITIDQPSIVPQAHLRQSRKHQPDAVVTAKPPPSKTDAPTTLDALSLYLQGRYAEAESIAMERLVAYPDDLHAMQLMVRLHANRGDLSQAMQWCEKAIAIDRVNPMGHYLLAVILQEQGRAIEAMLSLKRTIYLDHDFVLAYFAFGNLCKQQGRNKEARKYFESALLLLEARHHDEILPESDGMVAGHLIEIIRMSLAIQEPVA